MVSKLLIQFVRVQPLNLLRWQKNAILLGLKLEYEQTHPIDKELIPANRCLIERLNKYHNFLSHRDLLKTSAEHKTVRAAYIYSQYKQHI